MIQNIYSSVALGLIAVVWKNCLLVNPSRGDDGQNLGIHTNPAFEEIWIKSQSLRPQQSLDKTVSDYRVFDVLYHIQRNYISSTAFNFPDIRVSYPAFEPISESNKDCFDARTMHRAGCRFIELTLGHGAPNFHEKGLANITRANAFHPKVEPIAGPFGYDVYHINSQYPRIDEYVDKNNNIYFSCTFNKAAETQEQGTCVDRIDLRDGNIAIFIFDAKDIPNVRDIEFRAMSLFKRFRERS